MFSELSFYTILSYINLYPVWGQKKNTKSENVKLVSKKSKGKAESS